MTENNQIEKIARLEANLSNLEDIVKTGFIDVKSDLKDIKDNIVSRIERVEINKLNQDEAQRRFLEVAEIQHDHESRIRVAEEFFNNIKGKYAIIAVIVGVALTIVTSLITSTLIKSFGNSSCTNNCSGATTTTNNK